MAGAVKTLTFAMRQAAIPACRSVLLKFSEGDLPAEYVSASEVQSLSGAWSYQFLIQEEDLPGALTMGDVRNANLIAPYWECPTAEEVPEEECPARLITCFDDIPDAEELVEGDQIAILRFDEECNLICLKKFPVEDFLPDSDALADLQSRMGVAETDIDDLQTANTGLNGGLAAANVRIDGVEDDVTNLTTRVGIAETEIDDLQALVAGPDLRLYHFTATPYGPAEELKDTVSPRYVCHIPLKFTAIRVMIGIGTVRGGVDLQVKISIGGLPLTATPWVVLPTSASTYFILQADFDLTTFPNGELTGNTLVQIELDDTGWINADAANSKGMTISFVGTGELI